MHARARQRIKETAAALLPVAAVLFALAPNLTGKQGLGSETLFDISDPLFGDYLSPPPRTHDDGSPVQYDWPRDRWLIERVHQGHFDLWNPLPGNGTPLPPDPGGVFSPLRLLLYAAPLPPYTAFVLFRVARLVVAALGAYLLSRRYALSRPASALVGVALGLSGGMLSQLPFATPQSVCWLPWVFWAQLRLAQKRTWSALVPLALCLAALLTGGHQPIIASMVVGSFTYGVGVTLAQRKWPLRWRVAALLTVGYLLALFLAAPALLASAELVANGHSYKLGDVSKAFRDGALATNRGALLPGAFAPLTTDGLRDRGAPYPYVLHFSCGVLTYILAITATVWRRWRLEWLLVGAMGTIICFQPPGFQWLGSMPGLKDILPRYTWILCVLPICMAAGWGVDALADAARYRRAPLFIARDGGLMRARWPRGGVSGTAVFALGGLACFALLAALLMWSKFPTIGQALDAFIDAGTKNVVLTYAPITAAVIVFVGCAALSKLHRGSRWILAIASCIELIVLARPHLSEPASMPLRRTLEPESAKLAQTIANEHTRAGSTVPVTIGWGWRDVRFITPLSPQRYARFLEAAAGPIYWTVFNVPGNRSALADLASVRYLLTPRSDAPMLDADPAVKLVRSIKGVSVYRNDEALPRARVVHQTILAGSTDAAVKQLASLTAGAVHASATPLGNSVILESVPGGTPPRLLQGGAATPAVFVTDEPDDIVLDVDNAEAGYLVLADTHYPGWKGTVDGEAREVYPANVGFRAVYVGPGHHRVEFHYRPASFRIGVACSAAAALACVALVAGRRRRRTRPVRKNAMVVPVPATAPIADQATSAGVR